MNWLKFNYLAQGPWSDHLFLCRPGTNYTGGLKYTLVNKVIHDQTAPEGSTLEQYDGLKVIIIQTRICRVGPDPYIPHVVICES